MNMKTWVSQLCPTLSDPMDCSLAASSIHGDSPGKNTGVGCHAFLQLVSSQPRDQTQVSYTAGGFFTIWATREASKQSPNQKSQREKLKYRCWLSRELFLTWATLSAIL